MAWLSVNNSVRSTHFVVLSMSLDSVNLHHELWREAVLTWKSKNELAFKSSGLNTHL